MELHACYFKDLGAFSTDQSPGTDDQNSTPARELEPPQPLLRSLDGGQHPCAKIGAKAGAEARSVQNRTEHFQRTLTALGAILLGPGLVAAIYGANVDLPGRDRLLDTLILIVGMVTVSLLSLRQPIDDCQ